MISKYAVCFAASCLLVQGLSARAQDRAQDASLDELIPQQATDDADAWASQGIEQQPPSNAETVSPVPPFEALDIPTPDVSAPETPTSPEEGAEPAEAAALFADIVTLDLPPAPELEWVKINDQLELAFPASSDAFPQRREFIDRFRQLREAEQFGEDSANVALRAARARADRELLVRQLRTYGYYDARVSRSFDDEAEDPQNGDRIPPARFAIIPGERYNFGAINLGQLNKAADHELFRSEFAIVSGDPLLADRIIERRNALATSLIENGYPFAEIAPPELLIDHARSEGDLTMQVNPGGKYVFGNVTSNLPDFLPSRHLARIARFEPGDTFQGSMEDDLRRAILATGLVSSVRVARQVVSEPVGEEPGELRLDVELEKGRLRTIAGAVGFGTEDGFKVQGSWEHRNLFPPEGALRIGGILGTREWLAGIEFKRNNFLDRDQLLSSYAYASNSRTEAVEARTLGVRLAFERVSNLIFQKPLSWLVGTELLLTDERNRVIRGIPRPRQEYSLASVFASATLDSSDSLLDPKRGYRATLFIAPEISFSFGRKVVYLRTEADASFYLPATDGVTLAARAKFANIQGARPFEIAPSRRIYAGGGSSVRGYGYQAVGPRNDFGEPTGGLSVVELSAEARIDTGLFDDSLQIVPFFDLGSVSRNEWPDFRFKNYGVGLGIRYETGFGPIRVDVGVPLNRNPLFDSPVAVYVSLGQAF